MTNGQLREAQRSFENLRQAVWEIEATFAKLFEGMGEIEHRLETLERK